MPDSINILPENKGLTEQFVNSPHSLNMHLRMANECVVAAFITIISLSQRDKQEMR